MTTKLNPATKELSFGNDNPPAKPNKTASGRGGKFRKGQSGNPAGRPPGSKNRVTEIKEAIEAGMVDRVQEDALEILETTISLAKQGDTTCIKILMDRLWPASRQDKPAGSGTGGINIIIKGLEVDVPAIDAERVEDDSGT